jgi:hypothetical protein
VRLYGEERQGRFSNKFHWKVVLHKVTIKISLSALEELGGGFSQHKKINRGAIFEQKKQSKNCSSTIRHSFQESGGISTWLGIHIRLTQVFQVSRKQDRKF